MPNPYANSASGVARYTDQATSGRAASNTFGGGQTSGSGSGRGSSTILGEDGIPLYVSSGSASNAQSNLNALSGEFNNMWDNSALGFIVNSARDTMSSFNSLRHAVDQSGLDVPVGIGVNGMESASDVLEAAKKFFSDASQSASSVIAKFLGEGASSVGSGFSSLGSAIRDSASIGAQSNADMMKLINETAAANNAWSAAEAQKNRDWQTWMSNTAHQREVTDLQAAGLNPVLSAGGGSGAPTGSGAVAQPDTSNTRLVAEVAMQAIEAAELNASALSKVATSNTQESVLGRLLNSTAGKTVQRVAASELTRLAIKTLFAH